MNQIDQNGTEYDTWQLDKRPEVYGNNENITADALVVRRTQRYWPFTGQAADSTKTITDNIRKTPQKTAAVTAEVRDIVVDDLRNTIRNTQIT